MIKTFNGYSDSGLDLAVKDAQKDLIAWMEQNIEADIQQVTTTSMAFSRNDMENVNEYWFTITILTRTI